MCGNKWGYAFWVCSSVWGYTFFILKEENPAKKVIAVMMAFFMALSLMACGKSQAEKDLEKAEDTASRLQKQAESAQSSYDSLKKDLDEYHENLRRLESAR